MRTTSQRSAGTRVLAAALASVSLSACAGDAGTPMDSHAEEVVMRIGAEATDELVTALLSRLTEAMRQGGPAAAIDVCSLEALELTRSVAEARTVAIKRTSSRARNPANAPDEAEAEALRRIQVALTRSGEDPGPWAERLPDGEHRYYRPLWIAAPCLACHGSREDMDPAVREALDARYPDDRARGYREGDFRGLVRVTVPASLLPDSRG